MICLTSCSYSARTIKLKLKVDDQGRLFISAILFIVAQVYTVSCYSYLLRSKYTGHNLEENSLLGHNSLALVMLPLNSTVVFSEIASY